MHIRKIEKIIRAQAISEGAGVTVHRTIGTQALKNLDPFLMLDHFGSENPNEYIAGFPDHPHRGFVTLTYMLNGNMQHKDSMGNTGNLSAGGAQWMKAASGVIHSEMPQQEKGLMRGFQLWINLPACEKMSEPAYQELTSNSIPEFKMEGMTVRILSGIFKGVSGVIEDSNTNTFYLDVSLSQQTQFEFDTPLTHACFFYVYEGRVESDSQLLEQHHLAVMGTGEKILIRSLSDNARLIVVGGRPIEEPIVQYGPFVMNTRTEIEQAFRDYHSGHLVQKKASKKER